MNPTPPSQDRLNNIRKSGVKIFIVYASAGTGHFKAAQGIYNYLRLKNKNVELKLIDALEKTNILFRNIYTYGYNLAVNYAPYLWALAFWTTYTSCLRPLIERIHFIINWLNSKKFAQFLIQENPDFIISTHFLPAQLSAYLKRNRKINSQLFAVITDFGIHPFWIYKGIDTYIVASDFTKKKLTTFGVKEENIKVFGIPVDLKFLKVYEKDALCRKINIEQNKFTVLIVTGSFGIGPIEELVDLLYKEVQVLVVCAYNKRLYKKLKNKSYPFVYVFGFVDNIQELMSISNIIITKPGGLTISEALVMELIPIFISPIPGQEMENIKVLARYGVGLSIKHIDDIKDVILDYKNAPDKIEKMKKNIRAIKKLSTLEELYNVVCQGGIGAAH